MRDLPFYQFFFFETKLKSFNFFILPLPPPNRERLALLPGRCAILTQVFSTKTDHLLNGREGAEENPAPPL